MMKRKRITLILEIIALVVLMGYIIVRWYIARPTVGDYFCLEAAGLMSYYVYENFKTQ